jgi:hypothetical protein
MLPCAVSACWRLAGFQCLKIQGQAVHEVLDCLTPRAKAGRSSETLASAPPKTRRMPEDVNLLLKEMWGKSLCSWTMDWIHWWVVVERVMQLSFQETCLISWSSDWASQGSHCLMDLVINFFFMIVNISCRSDRRLQVEGLWREYLDLGEMNWQEDGKNT